MPIHLNYQGTICQKCGAEFIAHQKNCQCPACGQTTDDFCDFCAATVASMKDHKQIYGNYFPETWFSGSIADTIQQIIFELFDNFEAEKPKDFYPFAIEQLARMEWGQGQEHLAPQTEQIALEVFEIYKTDPDFRGNNLRTKSVNPKLKEMKRDQLFDGLSNDDE